MFLASHENYDQAEHDFHAPTREVVEGNNVGTHRQQDAQGIL